MSVQNPLRDSQRPQEVGGSTLSGVTSSVRGGIVGGGGPLGSPPAAPPQDQGLFSALAVGLWRGWWREPRWAGKTGTWWRWGAPGWDGKALGLGYRAGLLAFSNPGCGCGSWWPYSALGSSQEHPRHGPSAGREVGTVGDPSRTQHCVPIPYPLTPWSPNPPAPASGLPNCISNPGSPDALRSLTPCHPTLVPKASLSPRDAPLSAMPLCLGEPAWRTPTGSPRGGPWPQPAWAGTPLLPHPRATVWGGRWWAPGGLDGPSRPQ